MIQATLKAPNQASADGAFKHLSLSIIVPVYRNAELVRACVNSLLEHLDEVADRSPRVLLINDSPDDEPVRQLLMEFSCGPHRSRIEVLTNEKNLGFVGAVNRGLDSARKESRDVLLVNSDTVTFAGTMRALLHAVADDPQVGFASPRSNNASFCSLPHFHGGKPPGPQESYERWKLLSRTMPPWHFVPTAVGFYMLITHSVLANHGGLRTDFGAGYEEENDLVMRAGKLGQRAILVNQAFAYHAGSASFALTDLDLDQHRHANHLKVILMHPEFVPLVRRYEQSPHFRAERIMTGLLNDAQGRTRLVFDLTGLGMHHNGTNEFAIAVVRRIVEHWSTQFRVCGIGTQESFKFHGLDQVAGLHRADPTAPGLHGIAIRLGQPFDLHHVNVLEGLAPVNIYAMLDTIAQDCGPLAVDGGFLELWDHVAEHANALLFISHFSQRQFCNRYPAARDRPQMAMLLSTRPAEYRKAAPASSTGQHILVLGNHFPHKASDTAARHLAATNPTLEIVVLGAETFQRANLTGYRSGTVDADKMQSLYADASAVVLPSHLEGFGFGIMHALAAGKPVVARRIPATMEILDHLDDVRGVYLFDTDLELPAALAMALKSDGSGAKSQRGPAWADWGDGMARVCLEALNKVDLFPRLNSRIRAADLIRRATISGAASSAGSPLVNNSTPDPAYSHAALSLSELVAKDGRMFIEHAYLSLLRRKADESGLAFYIAQLEAGVDKREIIRALATSPEGRSRSLRMEGLADLLDSASRKPLRSILKRLLVR